MAMTTMTVLELWRYPVKSMQGERVERVELRPGGGVDGDRCWGVVDQSDGKILSAKRWGRLLEASARPDGDEVVVTLPDRSEHRSDDPGVHATLSAWLDRDVRLERAPTDRALAFDMGTDPTDDATAADFQWSGPPGRFVDLADVHLLSTASLTQAAGEHPDGQWDVRRFRPTALLTSEDGGYAEDAWVGSKVQIGGATIDVLMATMRCAMPTRPQPGGLERDLDISKTLQRAHDNNLGIYANVAVSGPVSVGDGVAPA
jgi:uncharacterized protein YcbX